MTDINQDWINNVLKNAKKKNSGNSDSKFRWTKLPQKGVFKFRLLPPDDQGRLGAVVGKHYKIPAASTGEGKSRTTHTCIENCSTIDEGHICPICEVLRKFNAEGIETPDQFNSSRQACLLGVVIAPDKDENGPHDLAHPEIIQMSEYNFTRILQFLQDPDIGLFYDLTKGNEIKMSREEKGEKWDIMIMPQSKPVIDPDTDPDGAKLALLKENAAKIDLYKMYKLPDDKSLEEIHKAAKRLEQALRVVVTSTAKQEAQDKKLAEKPVEQAKEKLPTTETTAIPSGAPKCFGDQGVFNPEKEQCLLCQHDIECSRAVKKVRAEAGGK